MKKKVWMVSLALLALVLCGTAIFSYAQQSDNSAAPAWSGHRHGGHMGYMAKALNLTDAQKQQIKSIRQANRASTLPLMQHLAQNRASMLAATAGGAFDQAKVTAIANQQAPLMAQMMVQKESIEHQIYTQVLTPEQRTIADQMRQKQMTRINERLQKMSQSGTATPGE